MLTQTITITPSMCKNRQGTMTGGTIFDLCNKLCIERCESDSQYNPDTEFWVTENWNQLFTSQLYPGDVAEISVVLEFSTSNTKILKAIVKSGKYTTAIGGGKFRKLVKRV
jgi:3-hydroxymyristoyl/3-hydroxydecanoyl-(acyl carrier protein) dehydratase